MSLCCLTAWAGSACLGVIFPLPSLYVLAFDDLCICGLSWEGVGRGFFPSNPRLARPGDGRSAQVNLIKVLRRSGFHIVLCSHLDHNPSPMFNDINSANNSGSPVWGRQIRS